MAEGEKLYTVEEAAKQMNVHKMTLYTQIRKGDFKGAVNIEKDDSLRPKWRIPESALHKGLVKQERRAAKKEKRAPEQLLMPDADEKRKLIHLIHERFPPHPGDIQDRFAKQIILFGTELAHGPDYAYLGASSREATYVIEIDSSGNVHDIHEGNKHPINPIASEAAMLAWKKEASTLQAKYIQLAERLRGILDEEDPLIEQIDTMMYQIKSRIELARRIGELILEVVKC